MRPTRFYSDRQEKAVAKAVRGKTVSGSGSSKFQKGDVTMDNWLLECKTSVSEKQSFSVKKEWFDKLKEQAFQMGKRHSSLVFDFGDYNRYYVVDEQLFVKMQEALDSVEKGENQ